MLWEESLKLDSLPTVAESVVYEYSEYFGADPSTARSLIFDPSYNEKLLAEWIAGQRRRNQEDVIAQFGTSPLFVEINLQSCAKALLAEHRIKALGLMQRFNCKTVLDFGGAIGNTVILFAKNGASEVWLAEISASLLEFAKWRAQKRGLKINTISLSDEVIPSNYFDLITAFAVFELIVDCEATVKTLSKALKPGGIFVVSVTYLADKRNRPWLLTVMPDFLFSLRRRHGFRRVFWHDDGSQIVAGFQKASPRLWEWFVSFADPLMRIVLRLRRFRTFTLSPMLASMRIRT